MSEISGLNGTHPIQPVAPKRPHGSDGPAQVDYRAPRDQVEISEVGVLLAELRDIPEIRVEKIARLRAEIEQGSFETPARIDGTIDRLNQELGEL